jgi:hypothetical protein
MDNYREQELIALLREISKDVSDMRSHLKSIAEDSYATKQAVKGIAKDASRIEAKLS